MNQLVRHLSVEVGAGEAQWSVTSRLAAHIGFEHNDIPGFLGTSMYGIGRCDDRVLEALAALNRCEVADLEEGALFHLGGSRRGLKNQVFNDDQFFHLRLRGCAACFLEDVLGLGRSVPIGPYLRTRWLLRTHRTCSRHGVELTEFVKVTHVKEFRDFSSLIRPFIPHFGEILATARKMPTPPLQEYVDNRLSGGPDETWFAGTPLYAVIWISDLLGFAKIHDRVQGLKKLSDEERWDVQSAGFMIGAAGPDAINELLATMDARFWDSKTSVGPGYLYRLLYNWLDEWGVRDPGYAEIRSVIREHLLDVLPMGPDDLIFGQPVGTRRIHSIASLTRTSGLHWKRVRQLLVDNGLVGPEAVALSDKRVLVPAEAGEAAVAPMDTAMHLSHIAGLLGASHKIVNALVRQGRIPHSRGTIRRPVRVRADIEPVLALLSKAVTLAPTEREGLTCLTEAMARANASLDDVLPLLLDGKLKRVSSTSENVLFSNILVDLDELKAAVRLEDHGHLRIAEAAEFIGVGYKMAVRLIQQGHLETMQVRNPINKSPLTVIKRDTAIQFRERWVTLAELGKRYSLKVLSLGVALRSRDTPMIVVSKTSSKFYDRTIAERIAQCIAARRTNIRSLKGPR